MSDSLFMLRDLAPILVPLGILSALVMFLLFYRYPRLALFIYIASLPLFEIFVDFGFFRMRMDDMTAVLGILAMLARHGFRPMDGINARTNGLLRAYFICITVLFTSAVYGYLLYHRINVYDTGRMIGNFVKTVFMVLAIRDRDDFIFVLKVYIAVFFLTGIYYYVPVTQELQHITNRYQAKKSIRTRDMGINANTYGYYLAIAVMFIIFLQEQGEGLTSRRRSLLHSAIMIFFLLILASLFFRMSLIAALLVFLYSQVIKKRAALVLFVLFSMTVTLFAASFIFDYIQTFDPTDIGDRYGRFWQGIALFKERPVFGHGLGQELFLIPLTSSHNSVSMNLSETGVIGFSTLVVFMVKLLGNLYRFSRKHMPLYVPFSMGLALLLLLSPTPAIWVDKTSMFLMSVLIVYVFICAREEMQSEEEAEKALPDEENDIKPAASEAYY